MKTATIGSYQWFVLVAQENGWSLAELRCDVPPTQEILALMDEVGLHRWERHVLRMERETRAALTPDCECCGKRSDGIAPEGVAMCRACARPRGIRLA